MFQSYFFGDVEFRNDGYKVNIQNQKRGKIVKLPFEIIPKKRENNCKNDRIRRAVC